MSRYFQFIFICPLPRNIVLRLCACLQCLDNDGTKCIAIMTDLRRRLDERALEREEEDYFNEDRYLSYFTSFVEFIELAWSVLTFGG